MLNKHEMNEKYNYHMDYKVKIRGYHMKKKHCYIYKPDLRKIKMDNNTMLKQHTGQQWCKFLAFVREYHQKEEAYCWQQLSIQKHLHKCKRTKLVGRFPMPRWYLIKVECSCNVTWHQDILMDAIFKFFGWGEHSEIFWLRDNWFYYYCSLSKTGSKWVIHYSVFFLGLEALDCIHHPFFKLVLKIVHSIWRYCSF
jgi:hypothetical protein